MPHSVNTPKPGLQRPNSQGSESKNPAHEENTMNPTDIPKPATPITMSAGEWAKTHRDFKTTIQGQRYVLRMTARGTSLVPVIVTKWTRS